VNGLLPVLGLIAVAAITPGPNNLIVLGAGARGGFAAAVPLILAIVAGSLALLLLAAAGLSGALRAHPMLAKLVAVAGTAYLLWLGAGLAWRAGRDTAPASARSPTGLPASPLGAAAFQFLNPKAWVLVTTVAAATLDAGGGLLPLAASLAVVSALCLALWAAAGSALAPMLSHPRRRAVFDRAMGGLLILSALGLLDGVLR
jgi:threonine/homoserine/homoserine lactone efflux protein